MGIDFYVTNSLSEYDEKSNSIDMSEELQNFFYKNKEKFPDEIEILLNLDPYGDYILCDAEIQKIYKFCDTILKGDYFKEYEDKEEAASFSIGIKELCKKALSDNKKIIAVGD
jgi:hypothetical protein